MKSIIFCSAEIKDYSYLSNINFSEYLIICADGGYEHAMRLGIIPNVIIGDNDSWSIEYPDSIETYSYPPDKDKTDTNLAIDYAIEHGCTEIEIHGGIGGRIDQEFTHFCLMKYALDKNITLKLIDDINEVWMENKSFNLQPNSNKKYVSFFSYAGIVENISIKNFKYEADSLTLDPGLVQASSNEFSDNKVGRVEFENGIVIVMLCNDRN